MLCSGRHGWHAILSRPVVSQSAKEALEDVAAWAQSMQAKQAAEPARGDAALPPPRNMRGNGIAAAASDAPDSAEGLRELGNTAFKGGSFADAEALYTRSLVAAPTAAAYANRAMARLKLQRWAEAEQDCTEALFLDALHVKALQRRGTARRAQGKLFEAACDFDTVARLEPGSKAALKERAEAVAAYERHAGVALHRPEAPIPVRPLFQAQAAVAPVPQQKGIIVDVQGVGEPWHGVREAALAEAPLVLAVSTTAAASPRKQSDAEQRKEPGPKVQGVQRVTMPAATEDSTATERAATDAEPGSEVLTQPAATEEDAATAAAQVALAARPLSAPRTGLEFESAWRRAAGRPEQQLQLLHLVDPTSLAALVKVSLDPQVLSAVAHAALTALLPVDAARAVAYLQRLTEVPRFGLIAMSMRKADKVALARAWDAVLGDSSPTSGAVRAELQRLRCSYGC
jgi:hypothetical protein